MANRLDWISDELDELKQLGLWRQRQVRQSPPVGGLIQLDGRQFINFGSNDYLGLAASQELVVSVQNKASELGVGSGASALVNGYGAVHQRLEKELAQFEKTESAVLFSTGFAANIGAITTLVGDGDVILSDELNHASII
ncbi:MAG: aminotransferase class I/II-fold pyridoxal phosphate-dependent enzyme, partial [Planctomycetota bacterium]